jgi:hypothetical protein
MYFITSVIGEGTVKENPAYRTMRSRTFGYALDLSTAQRYVNDNVGNMRECLYDYIVIEEINPGIHSLTEREEWYEWAWDGTKWKWTKCEKPSEFLAVTNWALG